MTDETLIDVPAAVQAEAAVTDEHREAESGNDPLEASTEVAESMAGESHEETGDDDAALDVALVPSIDLTEVKRILEAALLVAGEPVPVSHLSRLFEPPLENDIVRKLLDDLRAEWSDRAVELVQVASGWRFQGKPSIQRSLDRLTPEKPPRYSRAVMETLAIIAYQQPVTRGDIEAIRGVDQCHQDAGRPFLGRSRRAQGDAGTSGAVRDDQDLPRRSWPALVIRATSAGRARRIPPAGDA